MKATPGPWKYIRTHQCSNDAWFVITNAHGYGPIFDVGGKDFSGQIAEAKYLITNKEEIEANAQLIAAAPALLSACESALDLLKKCATYTREGNLYDHDSWTYELSAAIDAARGEL